MNTTPSAQHPLLPLERAQDIADQMFEFGEVTHPETNHSWHLDFEEIGKHTDVCLRVETPDDTFVIGDDGELTAALNDSENALYDAIVHLLMFPPPQVQ